MKLFKFLAGCWLYAHDVADRFIKETITEAEKKKEEERNSLEKFLLLSKEGEESFSKITDLIGLVTREDIRSIEKRIDLLISRKGK